jgi:hypothetical protein
MEHLFYVKIITGHFANLNKGYYVCGLPENQDNLTSSKTTTLRFHFI